MTELLFVLRLLVVLLCHIGPHTWFHFCCRTHLYPIFHSKNVGHFNYFRVRVLEGVRLKGQFGYDVDATILKAILFMSESCMSLRRFVRSIICQCMATRLKCANG